MFGGVLKGLTTKVDADDIKTLDEHLQKTKSEVSIMPTGRP